MKHEQKLALAGLIGIILGWPTSAYLFPDFFQGSAGAIIPWGLIGIAICFWATVELRKSLLYGAVFGSFLILSFCLANLHLKYTSEPTVTAAFFLIASLIGLISGAFCGLLAYFLHKLTKFRP